MSDNLISAFAAIANDDERVKRVEAFEIKMRNIPVNGKYHVAFECSEEVVVPASLLRLVVNRASQAADKMGDAYYHRLDKVLTLTFQECLMRKTMFFYDEVEGMEDRIKVIEKDMCLAFNNNFDMVLQKIGLSELN